MFATVTRRQFARSLSIPLIRALSHVHAPPCVHAKRASERAGGIEKDTDKVEVYVTYDVRVNAFSTTWPHNLNLGLNTLMPLAVFHAVRIMKSSHRTRLVFLSAVFFLPYDNITIACHYVRSVDRIF